MSLRCSRCGLESELRGLFRKDGSDRYCPRCWRRREERRARGWLGELLVFVAIGVFLLLTLPGESPGFIVLNAALLAITGPIGVAAHEIGHAVAARAAGMRVFEISLGLGRPVFRTRLLGARLLVRSVPAQGYTTALPRGRRAVRPRLLAFALGGPLANVALAAAAWPLLDTGLGAEIARIGGGFAPLGVWILTQLGLLFFALVPWRLPGGGISDGLTLAAVLFMSREHCDEVHAATLARRSEELLDAGRLDEARRWSERALGSYPRSPTLRAQHADVLFRTGDPREARRLLRELLDEGREHAPPSWRAHLMTRIAQADLAMCDDTLLEEADAYTERAERKLPWEARVVATRGAVLLRTGRPREALELLEEAFREAEEPLAKAYAAAWLAEAHTALGRSRDAARYEEAARSLDPTIPERAGARRAGS